MKAKALSLGNLNLLHIIQTFQKQVYLTWLLVLIENILLALIPLFIGYTIDGLLVSNYNELIILSSVFLMLTLVSVIRRIYDTRIYGTIRVHLGIAVHAHHQHLAVSQQTVRLDMAKELVNFLEQQVPEILTAIIQIGIALIILSFFHPNLAFSALFILILMLIIYTFFHSHFYHLNAALNEQMEQQVSIIKKNNRRGIFKHLKMLRHWEIALSDKEAILYGLIFIMITLFISYNLWFSTQISSISTGTIFSIITYSWEYVEASIMLPITLQSWSRLHEITKRIN